MLYTNPHTSNQMQLLDLIETEAIRNDPKALQSFTKIQAILADLNTRTIPASLFSTINAYLTEINSSTLTGKELEKLLKTKLSNLLKLLEKELKLVPKNHYRTQWMVLGMSAFGLPLGVAYGIILDNLGLMGLGLPIGMGIGVAVGTAMDEKARKAGNQLPCSA